MKPQQKWGMIISPSLWTWKELSCSLLPKEKVKKPFLLLLMTLSSTAGSWKKSRAYTVTSLLPLWLIVNDAVDEVRRSEAKENELLNKTRYLWLKNPEKFTKKQQKKLESLNYENLDTVKAY
jgi:hypothetical protein